MQLGSDPRIIIEESKKIHDQTTTLLDKPNNETVHTLMLLPEYSEIMNLLFDQRIQNETKAQSQFIRNESLKIKTIQNDFETQISEWIKNQALLKQIVNFLQSDEKRRSLQDQVYNIIIRMQLLMNVINQINSKLKQGTIKEEIQWITHEESLKTSTQRLFVETILQQLLTTATFPNSSDLISYNPTDTILKLLNKHDFVQKLEQTGNTQTKKAKDLN